MKDEDENIFICDRHIAPTVAELNKKGYKTVYSCEGHIVFGWTEIDHCNLSLLKDALSALYEWAKKLPKKKTLNHNSNAP